MADWRDGAEYAPLERPDGFATPRAEPLETPPPRLDLAAGAPLQHPATFQPNPTPVPPLEALVPATGPSRDPMVAFDSASEHISDGSAAWGAAHAQAGPTFNPRAPMAVSTWQPDQPFGAPSGSPAQFAPPTGTPVAPAIGAPAPGTFGPPAPGGRLQSSNPTLNQALSVIRSVGWPLFAVLAAGVLIRPLSGLLLIAAIVLTTRTKVARNRLQQIHGIAASVALIGGLFLNQTRDPLDAINIWSQVCCMVLLVLTYLFASQAKRPS
ncbi:hypothetical protein [Aestuariimicrobium ganziense]|uniref:hypothetical protein n=1 Tax=Aestuariimicrobium ganziense TaxID=2773677 RepID=UPI001941C43B|nr:hypothetical protein [Aestuariimicrobium ganziense]